MSQRVIMCIVAALLSGCGGARQASSPEPQPDQPQPAQQVVAPQPFAELPCHPKTGGEHGYQYELAARAQRLKLADPVDYLAVKRVSGKEAFTLAETGTACAGASDVAACRAALAALEQARAPASSPCDHFRCEERAYALTTRGGDAKLWLTQGEIYALLGPIDTPSDAWLMMQAERDASPYLCGDIESSAAREVDGGYELRERRYTSNCRPLEMIELIHRVGHDGSVRLLERNVLRHEPDECITGSKALHAPK
jgi:hypothetical protein